MKRILLCLAVIASVLNTYGIEKVNGKKVLDHTCFDSWKRVQTDIFTPDGEWCAYEINPQEGDGTLYFYNTKTGKKVEIERGYRPAFTADGKWGVASIKAVFSENRKAKIAKKKDYDLPQDSLAIVNLKTLKIEKIGNVPSFKIGKKGIDWLAYTTCDTLYSKPKNLKDKEYALPLVVKNLNTGVQTMLKNVEGFDFNRQGTRLALKYKKIKKDSLSFSGIGIMNLPDTVVKIFDKDKKFYGSFAFDYDGNQFAVTASNDSVKTGTKRAFILWNKLNGRDITGIKIESKFIGIKGDTLIANQYTKPEFSRNGKRLISGVAPIIAPDDTTIVDFEQPALDIWRWDAPYTSPQELKNATKIKEKVYPVVVNLSDMHQTLVDKQPLSEVSGGDLWNADWALVVDPTEDMVENQWNYFSPAEVSVVNVNSGDRKVLGKVPGGEARLSPNAKYVYWYSDKNFYTYDIASGDTVNVTANMPVAVWNTDDDHPMPPEAWAAPLWAANDEAMLIFDKYDLWKVDPQGKEKAICLTKEEGKNRNWRFRFHKTSEEWRYAEPGKELLLDVFDYTSKYNGLATLVYGKPASPAVGVLNGYAYTQVKKAADKNVYMWQRANFSTSPDVWACVGTDFLKAKQLSDANPQMKEFRWGTAQLVKWRAYDGKESEGVLYVPDDIDPNEKYPMLCVFYETGSEDLYYHYTMEPSWSWVNYPFYVSRGYVIFVPDIHYTAGLPGESCYNYVCSGAEEMCKRYPWIDKDRIGIDGQSWGGYQTAYLVTRTNMFACAGSGAPVANMTSAFGGIRWESGSSRQGQYEMGQSRIGRNLWDATELYIANSPVFRANRVETPLLIMHNDNDGAVPWYQGIEMFMALRRLQKPVWMLQYNGEAHNIRARKNRKDITRRLQQFFDHYLKGDPMPKWMKEGIPVVRKGQELGY